MMKTKTAWGVKWRQDSPLDGYREYLLWDGGFTPILFKTKKLAKMYIDKQYSYIKVRKDLRSPPHNWRLPIAVKVSVTTEEIKTPTAASSATSKGE